MFKNYIVTAVRNLIRNKVYTFINVFGLALGISTALVLFKIVIHEQSFDKHQSNYENLYRFVKKVESPNKVELEAGMQNPVALSFKNDFPDLGIPVRTFGIGSSQLTINRADESLQHFEQKDGIAFVDSTFFQLFDYKFELGNASSALSEPKSVVISEALVQKLFGKTVRDFESVIGEKIRLNDALDVYITGIVANPPSNSSVPFHMLINYESIVEIFDFYQPESWSSTSSNANVYFLMAEGVTTEQVDDALASMADKYIKDTDSKSTFFVQPFSEVHFHPEFDGSPTSAVDEDFITIPIAIAIFLILTACINFINLSTALAIKRSKEVGIRKVLGGKKQQLIFQFLGETFFITFISVLISLGGAELMMTNMETLIGYNLSLNLFQDGFLVIIIVAITIVVTLLAGLYPSFILAKLKPVLALKSKGQSGLSVNVNTRRALVVFQFVISQVLVVCTLIVMAQMKYFESQELGFRKSAIINFPLPTNESEKLEPLRNELFEFAGIEKVSFNFSSPLSDNNIGSTFGYAPLEMEGAYDVAYKVIDDNYLDLYEIKLLAGRNFNKNDTLGVAIITEAVMKLMLIDNPEDAIGKKIESGFSGPKTIVGVINDFHTSSLKYKLEPVVFVTYNGYFYEGAVRFEGSAGQLNNLISAIEKAWVKQYPNVLFDYTLFSESIMKNYSEEASMMNLFKVFSGIAILIGCLGLYGLVAFLASQKTKEIGIRKVLGASVNQILTIFSKELVILIAIAFLLASPFAYYFMNQWLSGFEYRISINGQVFFLGIGFTLLIAGLTTGMRSFKAARANPVDSLRSE